MSKQNQKVDFVVAGAQKAGTSALFTFLEQHPQIRIPTAKELHFFSDDEAFSTGAAGPDFAAYHDNFHKPTAAHRSERIKQRLQALISPPIWGDITPIYMYWPTVIERIRAYNPKMKIIVILRNPVERAYSQWKMETKRGWDTLPFSQAIREGRSRVAENTDPRGYHRIFSYVERGFYAQQLDHILEHFPKDQLLILKHEDLLTEHNKTLDRVCAHLDVKAFKTYPKQKMVNSISGDMPSQDRDYLETLFAEDLKNLKNQYGVTF